MEALASFPAVFFLPYIIFEFYSAAAIGNLGEALEGEMEMLDGYEELPENFQEKVKRAIENGHVDDEDWKGDLGQNRPGKRGFRSPAPKKQKKVEDEEHSGGQEGGESPSKAAPKKRGRAKKEDLEDDEPEESARKKRRVAAKKPAKVKDEEEDIDEPNTDARETNAKKGKQPKGQSVAVNGASEPKRKAAAKKTKTPREDAMVDGSDTLATTPEKTNEVGKRGKKASSGDGSLDPVKAAGRPRKAATKDTVQQDLAGEHEEQTAKTTKRPRVSKSAANTKKPIIQKAQKSTDAAKETAVAAEPKAKRGRKKADS
ncbi:MAG: hypothetical protein Q9224_000193 [Gallowayella concinna]